MSASTTELKGFNYPLTPKGKSTLNPTIDLGPVDVVKYAEAFGATGGMIRTPDEIAPVLKEALNHSGPIIVGVHVDYSDNHKLFEMVKEDRIH